MRRRSSNRPPVDRMGAAIVGGALAVILGAAGFGFRAGWRAEAARQADAAKGAALRAAADVQFTLWEADDIAADAAERMD